MNLLLNFSLILNVCYVMIAPIISFFATIMVNRCLSMDEMLLENATYKSGHL